MMQDNKNSKQTKRHGAAQAGGLYIALSLCILAVICVATYSAIKNMFDINEPLKPIVTKDNAPIIDQPGISPEPNATAESPVAATTESDEPVVVPPETTPVELPVNEPGDDKPVSVEPPYIRTYQKPINGNVLKAFSGDVLVFSSTMNDYRTHNGIDILCAVGDGVKCFSDGFVESITEDPLMGYTITVNHENGLKSVYQNLSEAFPQDIGEGVRVSTGQIIAGIGESALIECAEQPHLHFSLIKEDVEIDPEPYF